MNCFGVEEEEQLVFSHSSCAMESAIDAAVGSPSSSQSFSPLLPFGTLARKEVANMDACREFYERRVQSLERFRRRVTPCQSLDEMTNPGGHDGKESSQQYVQLQSDLVELMEKDVNLMRQLMALGERIEELKTLTVFTCSSSTSSTGSSPNAISPTSSMISLDGICEEEPNDHEEKDQLRFITSHVLTVDNVHTDHADECEEENHNYTTPNRHLSPPKVYFSRQNSILRIPIPPSRGFRSKTTGDIQTQNSIILNNSMVKRGHSSACETSSSDDAASCASNASEYGRGAGWYARKKNINKSTNHALRKCPPTNANDPQDTSLQMQMTNTQHYHASQSSCDSGVHHLNNSVDTFDGEDLIYV